MQTKVLIGVLLAAVALFVGKIMFFSAPSAEKRAKLQVYYSQVGGYKLGEAIAKDFSAKKVLVMLPEDMAAVENKMAGEMLAGLKEASTAAGFTITEVSLKTKTADRKPQEGETAPPALRQGSEWDRVLAQDGKDCTVLITFISLPVDVRTGVLAPPAGIDKFKVVTIGEPGDAAKSIVKMSLLVSPEAATNYPTSKDREKVFAARWKLKTN